MAWVTDGAHDEDDIKSMERFILSVRKIWYFHICGVTKCGFFLKVLGTAFMPVTPCEWVAIFLHEAGVTGGGNVRSGCDPIMKLSMENQLPIKLYSKICRVCDLKNRKNFSQILLLSVTWIYDFVFTDH